MPMQRRILTGISAIILAFGVPVGFAQPAQADTFTYMIYGESLDMSEDGPWWNKCHHFVHFTYPNWMDGHIVSFSVQSLDPFAMPSVWGTPSNQQANAGYHLWGQPDCAENTRHSPADFWLWLTVDQSPF